MKTIFQLYAENGYRAGFVVRHCLWCSGFAMIHSIDGLTTITDDSVTVIATIVDTTGVRKGELRSANELVWEIQAAAY
ncbi:hypothetical protein ACXDTJ_003767 [Klebsiella quasipneumoniae]|jgi:hypothetical protein